MITKIETDVSLTLDHPSNILPLIKSNNSTLKMKIKPFFSCISNTIINISLSLIIIR